MSESDPSQPIPVEVVEIDADCPHKPRCSWPARGIVRFFYTHNPFYLLSGWLVFSGLRVSFSTEAIGFESQALLIGLAGYTLLIALTAWFLIWVGKVWDDVRTLLLLIVLMLLATSVTFDHTLTANAEVGRWYFIVGLAFAVFISEGLLHGLGMRLPLLFRLPYYLVLALFFLYPVAIAPLLTDPEDPMLHWGLAAFPTAAGAVFLTLLPAIRRGAEYVRDNGTPWHWPLYPWSLFFVLALAVCARSYYVCVSLHLVGGNRTIFAPYFLVPFLLALNVLLLELGLVARRAGEELVQLVLAMPLGLLALATTGRPWLDDLGFCRQFMATLGGSPLWVTLIAVAVFYAIAAIRRTAGAFVWLTLAVAALAVIGRRTFGMDTLTAPWGVPLLAAGGLQFVRAAWTLRASRFLLAAILIDAGLLIELQATPFTAYGSAAPLHLLLAAVLLIGLVFKNDFARLLQYAGALALLVLSVLVLVRNPESLGDPPPWAIYSYPLACVVLAVPLGWLAHNRMFHWVAAGCAASWLTAVGVQLYQALHGRLIGLDQLVWGLAFFLVAMLISLWKAGLPQRWLKRFGPNRPPIC